jgi:SNF2 family DNA or RNA helicase
MIPVLTAIGYAYLCRNTIEERIDEIISEKRTLFGNVIDGIDTAALRRLDRDLLMNALERDVVHH